MSTVARWPKIMQKKYLITDTFEVRIKQTFPFTSTLYCKNRADFAGF